MKIKVELVISELQPYAYYIEADSEDSAKMLVEHMIDGGELDEDNLEYDSDRDITTEEIVIVDAYPIIS